MVNDAAVYPATLTADLPDAALDDMRAVTVRLLTCSSPGSRHRPAADPSAPPRTRARGGAFYGPDGCLHFTGAPAEQAVYKSARQDDDAKFLLDSRVRSSMPLGPVARDRRSVASPIRRGRWSSEARPWPSVDLRRMPIEIGVFVRPDASDPAATLAQVHAADEAGLDVVGVQDHPYQRRYFDTWTLLAYAAGQTSRVKLAPDVASLPLRPPALLAKAAASLDVLSGGRVEFGLGAGAFWEAIGAMGGPVRTPKQSVDAVVEAIGILRGFWDGERSLTRRGEHYDVHGVRPGPLPAHRIGIWLGAYGPRMLRITGRLADGWLPSLGEHYLSPEDVPSRQAAVDEAARRADRRPEDILRVVNVMALSGSSAGWADQLARISDELRFSTLLVGVPDEDPTGFVRRLGEDVAPAVKARVG